MLNLQAQSDLRKHSENAVSHLTSIDAEFLMVNSLTWMLSHSFLTTMKNRRSLIYSDIQDVSILLSAKYFQIHIWYKFNNTNIVRF